MVREVILVGDDYETLMRLAVALHGTPDTLTVAESARPLERALELARLRPRAMLVTLDGTENVVDVRSLLSTSPETGFVLVVPEMPVRAPLARVVKEHEGLLVSRRDAPIVVVATLLALLAAPPAARHPSGAG